MVIFVADFLAGDETDISGGSPWLQAGSSNQDFGCLDKVAESLQQHAENLMQQIRIGIAFQRVPQAGLGFLAAAALYQHLSHIYCAESGIWLTNRSTLIALSRLVGLPVLEQ